MRDFVSPITTHVYVEELERRIAALERLVSAIEVASVEPAKPKVDRREYMRNLMAEKRRKAREQLTQ